MRYLTFAEGFAIKGEATMKLILALRPLLKSVSTIYRFLLVLASRKRNCNWIEYPTALIRKSEACWEHC